MWYSLLDYGACSLHASPAANCTWNVTRVEKIVSKACHATSFFGAVQAARPSCFSQCASSTVNASDPCYIRCFYEAVLGPTAGRPFGKVEGGLPLVDVLAYWKRPFESEDAAQGGCPALPIPPHVDGKLPTPVPTTRRTRSRRQERWRAFLERDFLWAGEHAQNASAAQGPAGA